MGTKLDTFIIITIGERKYIMEAYLSAGTKLLTFIRTTQERK